MLVLELRRVRLRLGVGMTANEINFYLWCFSVVTGLLGFISFTIYQAQR